MSEAAPAPVVNLFGLTQYDGLTTFFGDQSFDYNGYVLPEVRIDQRFPQLRTFKGHAKAILEGKCRAFSGCLMPRWTSGPVKVEQLHNSLDLVVQTRGISKA